MVYILSPNLIFSLLPPVLFMSDYVCVLVFTYACIPRLSKYPNDNISVGLRLSILLDLH